MPLKSAKVEGSEWCGPMNKASTNYVHRRTNEPLDTGMNQVHKCASPSERYVDFQVVV